jgi:hypothetical protein
MRLQQESRLFLLAESAIFAVAKLSARDVQP